MAQEESKENQNCCRRLCHLEYFRTLDGMGKILQFIVVLLGLIIMSTVSAINATAIKFFIFVHSAGSIFIAIHILLNLAGIFQRLPLLIISNFTYMIACALAALLFLICSALTLDKYADSTVKVASVVGLIAFGLFVLETVYHIIQHKRGGRKQAKEMKAAEAASEATAEQPPSY